MAVITEEREPSCDFCNNKEYAWIYPVDDFNQQMVTQQKNFSIEMLGDWLACDTCHSLIETNQRDQLTEHSLSTYDVYKTSAVYEPLKKRIERLHDEFFFYLKGKPEETTYEDVSVVRTEIELL